MSWPLNASEKEKMETLARNMKSSKDHFKDVNDRCDKVKTWVDSHLGATLKDKVSAFTGPAYVQLRETLKYIREHCLGSSSTVKAGIKAKIDLLQVEEYPKLVRQMVENLDVMAMSYSNYVDLASATLNKKAMADLHIFPPPPIYFSCSEKFNGPGTPRVDDESHHRLGSQHDAARKARAPEG